MGFELSMREQLKSNLKGKVGTTVRVMYARNSWDDEGLLNVSLEPNIQLFLQATVITENHGSVLVRLTRRK